MTMTYKQKALVVAARLGVNVQATSLREIACEAPEGHHFACSGVHELVYNDRDREGPLEMLWKALYNDLAFGLEACTNECEYWNLD
jgi:hypothetical protein